MNILGYLAPEDLDRLWSKSPAVAAWATLQAHQRFMEAMKAKLRSGVELRPEEVKQIEESYDLVREIEHVSHRRMAQTP